MSFSKASVLITLIICSLLAFISASTVVEHCVFATCERDVKVVQINKERTLKLQKMEYFFDLSERFKDKKIFEEISK